MDINFKKFVSCLILIIVLGNFTHGQHIISGKVSDSLQRPLDRINVYLKSTTTNNIISFTFSNQKGEYQLETEASGSHSLIFSGLSYETKSFALNLDTINVNKEYKQNVTLYHETLALDEVVIAYEKKVTVKKDTVVFKASAFANGREEVIEDLLQKLPGLEVKNDGTITVEGKNIEKVMVEGDDLFEKGYKLLTKNLNASVIDKVEVYKKYSDNSLLKGVEDSDKVALNLTLKEGMKSQIFGNSSLGYGSDNRYEAKINLISFLKKVKSYIFGNLNNIGSDPTGDIGSILNPNALNSSDFVGDNVSLSNFINLNSSNPDLGEKRTNFNNAEFTSLNSIYSPNKSWKIKAIGFLTFDENDFFKDTSIRYQLPDTSFTNTEDFRLRKKYRVIYGKINSKYELSKKSNINYTGQYNYNNTSSNSSLLFNDNNLAEKSASTADYIDHKIDYTIKTNKNKAFILQSRYLNQKLPEEYSVNQYIYQDLFENQEDISSVRQEIMTKLNFFGLTANYIVNGKKSNFSIKLGATLKKEQVLSNLLLINNDGIKMNNESDYSNDFKFKNVDIFTEIAYKYDLNKISLSTTLKTNQIFTTIQENNTTDEIQKNPFFVTPGFQFQYNINKKNKFVALYSYNTQTSDLKNITSGYYLSNYRNFSRGIGSFNNLASHFSFINYTYGNWSDEFLINSSFIYSSNEDFFSSNILINPNYNQISEIILPNKKTFSFSGSIDRYINKLSSNIKIKASFSSNDFKNVLNNSNIRDINSQVLTYGTEYRSAFIGLFNFHIGTTWNVSVFKTSIETRNMTNTTFLDLIFNLSQKFSFQIQNERRYFSNSNANNTFYFTDFDIKYVVKPNKLSFKIIGQNMLNTDIFEMINISDRNISSSQSRLIPRYMMLKMDFRF